MLTEADHKNIHFYEAYLGFSAQLMIMSSGRILDWQKFEVITTSNEVLTGLFQKIDAFHDSMDYRTTGLCCKQLMKFSKNLYQLTYFISSDTFDENEYIVEQLQKFRKVCFSSQ